MCTRGRRSDAGGMCVCVCEEGGVVSKATEPHCRSGCAKEKKRVKMRMKRERVHVWDYVCTCKHVHVGVCRAMLQSLEQLSHTKNKRPI